MKYIILLSNRTCLRGENHQMAKRMSKAEVIRGISR